MTNAIAVGYGGEVYATTDGGVKWYSLYSVINNSGVGNLITNPNNNLVSVRMTDDNTFIISSVIKPYYLVNGTFHIHLKHLSFHIHLKNFSLDNIQSLIYIICEIIVNRSYFCKKINKHIIFLYTIQ